MLTMTEARMLRDDLQDAFPEVTYRIVMAWDGRLSVAAEGHCNGTVIE